MNQKGNSLLLLSIGLILLVLVGGGAFYVGRSTANPQATPIPVIDYDVIKVPSSPDLSVSAPVPELDLFGPDQKRSVGASEKLIDNITYPAELYSQNDLLTLNCATEFIRDDEKGYYVYNKKGPKDSYISTQMTQEELIMLAEKSFEVDFRADVYRACKVEDGRYLLEYGKYAGDEGEGDEAFFGVLNTDNTFEKITEIPSDGAPYFGCYKPLQLTKSNILWYRCGGGDAGFGSASVYKIDLNNKTHTRVLRCTSVTSLDPGEHVTETKCE